MKKDKAPLSRQLRTLLVMNRCDQKGFENVVKTAQNPRLSAYFKSKSEEKKGFVAALKSELQALGDDSFPADERCEEDDYGWIDFTRVMKRKGDEEVLQVVIRGEKTALEDYDEALRPNEIPETTTNLLRDHYDIIQSGLIEISTLKDL